MSCIITKDSLEKMIIRMQRWTHIPQILGWETGLQGMVRIFQCGKLNVALEVLCGLDGGVYLSPEKLVQILATNQVIWSD